MRWCWIAQGKLFTRGADGAAAEHVSEFGREAMERAAEQRRHRAWKSKPGGGPLFSRSALWGNQVEDDAPLVPPRVLHVAPGRDDDEIYYVLGMSRSCGLFRYRFADRLEHRLFHKEDFVQHGVAFDRARGCLLAAIADERGTAALWELDGEGRQAAKLTDGDVVDAAPCPSRKTPGDVLYQSTGVGRDPQGRVAGYAPTVINRLSRESGAVATVKEDPRWDYLQPYEDGEGRLWCIRRPTHGARPVSPWELLKDFVLFPWRLLVAIFHFLNVFSVMFAKRPLRMAGPERPFDARRMMVKGMVVDAERLARERGDRRSLVPSSWQLLRIAPDGAETVVASKVLSFWIAEDGAVITTDGFAIRAQRGAGEEVVERGELIEHLCGA